MDNYKVVRTATGWHVSHIAIGGPCDRTGAPYLFENLQQDSVNYPKHLGEYLEYLWNKADEEKLSEEKIQEGLNEIAQWIAACEQASPDGIFEYFK